MEVIAVDLEIDRCKVRKVLYETFRVFADESDTSDRMMHKRCQSARADLAMERLHRRGSADGTA
ncbi:hypothetical protein [Microbacterium tumbae]